MMSLLLSCIGFQKKINYREQIFVKYRFDDAGIVQYFGAIIFDKWISSKNIFLS